jgi:hypothetical protein
MDPNRGQFMSQDPTFLAMGDPNQIKKLTKENQTSILSDPQMQNSYGYARDNPITNKDATGLITEEAKMFFRGIDVISNILFGRTALDHFTTTPAESVRELSNDSAQYHVDGFLFLVGQAAGATTLPGFAINVGGLGLMGYDYYCGNQPCTTLQGSQFVSPRAILASMPKPAISIPSSGSNSRQISTQNFFSGSSVQERAAAVNAYNTASGYTAPQDKYWVTPSGAVVTWYGEVKSQPITSTQSKK